MQYVFSHYVRLILPSLEDGEAPRLYSLRLPAVGTLKRYSKALEYKYRVKTDALGTLKRYSILSLTLYLEWYNAYSILYSDGPTS
jgi:hypothetical protein